MVNTAQNDFDGLVLAAEDNDTFNVIDIVKTHLDERRAHEFLREVNT